MLHRWRRLACKQAFRAIVQAVHSVLTILIQWCMQVLLINPSTSPLSLAQVANNPFNYSIANVISPRPNPEDHVDRDCRALDRGRRAAAVKWTAPPELQRKGVHDLDRDCRAAVVNWTAPSELLPRECATSILAAASSLSTGRRRHQNCSRAPDKACAWSAAPCCDHPSTLLRRMLQLVVFTLFCLSGEELGH